MYLRYGRTLDALLSRDRSMRRNFEKNNFGAMTMNLGPNTVTFRHLDHLNVPWGFCAVTAFGDYDPLAGGHLIFWDLAIAIEFPPGSTILLPSAIIWHSNVAIAEDERRFSITQYSAGGLLRWVDCGFQTQQAFNEQRKHHQKPAEERWQEGLSHWSTWACIRQTAERLTPKAEYKQGDVLRACAP